MMRQSRCRARGTPQHGRSADKGPARAALGSGRAGEDSDVRARSGRILPKSGRVWARRAAYGGRRVAVVLYGRSRRRGHGGPPPESARVVTREWSAAGRATARRACSSAREEHQWQSQYLQLGLESRFPLKEARSHVDFKGALVDLRRNHDLMI